MEVKVYGYLNNLPNVFILPDLNKVSITSKFVNCSQGCVKAFVSVITKRIETEKTKEVKGIYFTPNPAIISVRYRQRVIRTNDDMREILRSLDFSKIHPKNLWILVKFDSYGYGVEVYDIYYKGMKYEFPEKVRHGNLRIYEVPKPGYAYRLEYDQNHQPVYKLNEEMLTKEKEIVIYNHKIIFENEIWVYNKLFVMPGDGALVYVPQSMSVKIESPDHEGKEIIVPGGTWLLLSHPPPRKLD